MSNNSFQSIKTVLAYAIASGFVLFGIYLVLAHINGGINRDIGFALITFFSALILIGATKKRQ